MTLSTAPVRAKRKDGLTISELDGEVLVYDPSTVRASCLNGFAAEVLARCDGKNSPGDIARELPFEGVDERVVMLALSDLQKAGLLAEAAAINAAALIGPSRRVFFKRLGISAAVAVPIVAGIELPAAAQSISGRPCDNVTNPCPIPYVCEHKNGPDAGNCDKPGNECFCVPPS